MICLPGYHYCGPGAPSNQLDYFCMQHDQCYRSGLPRRLCDEQFLRQLAPYVTRRDKLGGDARLMYRVISFKLGF